MSVMRRNLSATSNLLAAATLRRPVTQPLTNTLHCNNELPRQYRGPICSQCTHRRTYSTPPPPKDAPTEKVTVDMSKKRRNVKPPLGWAGLGVILAAGSGLIWYVRQVKEETVEEQKRRDTKRIGKPSIGGPFTLVNTKGEEVTEQDFIGKWVLVYFGFCNCPDICPDQLDKITEVVNRVNSTPHIPNIQPVYITVDPLRDTPQIMDEYLQDFHPDFIGLTGTVEQVKAACKTYRYVGLQYTLMVSTFAGIKVSRGYKLSPSPLLRVSTFAIERNFGEIFGFSSPFFCIFNQSIFCYRLRAKIAKFVYSISLTLKSCMFTFHLSSLNLQGVLLGRPEG